MSKESRKRLKAKNRNNLIPNKFIPTQAIKIDENNCPQIVIDSMLKGDSGTINRLLSQGSIEF